MVPADASAATSLKPKPNPSSSQSKSIEAIPYEEPPSTKTRSPNWRTEDSKLSFEKSVGLTVEPVEKMPIFVRSVAFGDVFGHAWKKLWPNLLQLSKLTIPLFIFTILLGVVTSGIAGFESVTEKTVSSILLILVAIAANLAFAFWAIGFGRICLRIGRNHPPGDIRQTLVSGKDKLWPIFSLLIVLSVISALNLPMTYVMLFALWFLFWPTFYLIIDDQRSMLSSFAQSLKLLRANVSCQIMLLFVLVLLTGLSLVTFGIGFFVTLPLMNLLLVSTYLAMTGQL